MKKRKFVFLPPAAAKEFFNSLVATAPVNLSFLSDDQRQKVLDKLEKRFCTGKPVKINLASDDVFKEAFANLDEGNEENGSAYL